MRLRSRDSTRRSPPPRATARPAEGRYRARAGRCGWVALTYRESVGPRSDDTARTTLLLRAVLRREPARGDAQASAEVREARSPHGGDPARARILVHVGLCGLRRRAPLAAPRTCRGDRLVAGRGLRRTPPLARGGRLPSRRPRVRARAPRGL